MTLKQNATLQALKKEEGALKMNERNDAFDAGKGKEMDSALETLEGALPGQHIHVALRSHFRLGTFRTVRE